MIIYEEIAVYMELFGMGVPIGMGLAFICWLVGNVVGGILSLFKMQ